MELSGLEQKVVKRIKRAKLFIFLRQVRHELFNDEFQMELVGCQASFDELNRSGYSN
jgi:hypothetical protein